MRPICTRLSRRRPLLASLIGVVVADEVVEVFSTCFDGALGGRAWGHVTEELFAIHEEVVLKELSYVGTLVSHGCIDFVAAGKRG
jgi:hypothetical protein